MRGRHRIARLKEIIKRLPDHVHNKILDVGCGDGWLTVILNNFGNVVAIDKQPHINIDVFCYVPEGSFDLIVCSEMIEHVKCEDQQKLLDRLYCWLTSGGKLILTTPNGNLWNEYKDRANQEIENWLTPFELARILSDAGFDMIDHATFFKDGLYQIYVGRKYDNSR